MATISEFLELVDDMGDDDELEFGPRGARELAEEIRAALTDYEAQQAALREAEDYIKWIAARYEGGYRDITHTVGQRAERVLAAVRKALKEEK